MFEKKDEPLLPQKAFLFRLSRSFGATLVIVSVSLLIGSVGYHHFGDLPWIDALLNAAMILTGMGPVDKMETDSGKLFAAFYALYSGLVFLTMVVVLVTPIYHRFIHRFHLDSEHDADRDDDAAHDKNALK